MKKVILCALVFFGMAIAVFSTLAIIETNTETERSGAFDLAMTDFREAIENKSAADIQKMSEEIMSEGEFAVAEKAIKEYLCNVYVPMKEAKSIQNGNIYKTGISIKLLNEDAPDFQKSYDAINSMQTKLGEIQDVVDNLFSYDAAMAHLPEDTDEKSIQLFKKETESTYNNNALKQDYQNYIDYIGNVSSHYRTIIDFLETNSTSWYIENGVITFKTTRLSEQYDALAKELRELKSH